MKRPKVDEDYLRSVIFGCEDGLVSTTGSVIGISVGSRDPQIVILAGLVIITVEAISMAAGEFLSQEAVQELDGDKRKSRPVFAALLMLMSYFVAGMIPLTPFLLFSLNKAIIISIGLAFISLFLLGVAKGKVIGVSKFKSGLKILIVGGVATTIGILVGVLLKTN